jgi:cbb3-type cytochrome oxidase subunit 3
LTNFIIFQFKTTNQHEFQRNLLWRLQRFLDILGLLWFSVVSLVAVVFSCRRRLRPKNKTRMAATEPSPAYWGDKPDHLILDSLDLGDGERYFFGVRKRRGDRLSFW